MLVDSGASSNIIDKQTWEGLKKKKVKCRSVKNNTNKTISLREF